MDQGNPVEQGLVPVWPFIRPRRLGTALIPQNWGTKSLPLLPLVLFVLPLGSLYHQHHNHACHLLYKLLPLVLGAVNYSLHKTPDFISPAGSLVTEGFATEYRPPPPRKNSTMQQ